MESGAHDKRRPSQVEGAVQVILKAMTLGLSTGIFCLGYCYPILAPVMLSRNNRPGQGPWERAVQPLFLFLLGRLAAYLLFGVLIGYMGQKIRTFSSVQTVVVPVLYLVLGSVLVLYGTIRNLPHWNLCRLGSRFFQKGRFLLLLGFMAGINVCPPFLLALTYVLGLGQIGKAVLFFLFFFLGTSVFFLPFLFSGLASRFANVRSAARVTAVAAGGWFIYLAVRQLITG